MSVFSDRRCALLDRLDGALILVAAPETIRNNGAHYPYRQHSDLYYLTGFDEPEAVLVVAPKHAEHKIVLFVRKGDPVREVYYGKRATIEDAKEKYGAEAAYTIDELDEKLVEYLTGHRRLYYELGSNRAFDDRIVRTIAAIRAKGTRENKVWPTEICEPSAMVHEMRAIKSDDELRCMRRAAAITRDAHLTAMRMAAPGRHEYEIEAAIGSIFRTGGSERVAYPPIVASGANATVLHYHANRDPLRDGDLLLIDAGCEYAYYASDVTRTFPVSGEFSLLQRRLYEIVLAAQVSAIEAVKPGTNLDALYDITIQTMVRGLLDEKLLVGDADKLIEEQKYKDFYMHRSSHWIGMDVHDVGAYYIDDKPRPLEKGMVFTIEPGLYIAPDNQNVPPEYRGIGIRIEDDILVTADGYENLTADIPKAPAEIERICRDAR